MANDSHTHSEGHSSASASPSTFKFPAFQPDVLPPHQEETALDIGIPVRSPSPLKNGENGFPPGDRWYPRKDKGSRWVNGSAGAGTGTRHGRQKSLSEAIRTIKGRRGSVSANAHEIAEALRAPVSAKLIVRSSRIPHFTCSCANRPRFSAAYGTQPPSCQTRPRKLSLPPFPSLSP